MQNDIVLDILDRIRDHLAGGGDFSDESRQQIDAQVRADWGGERCYIPKQGETTAILMIRRDIEMRRMYRAGNSVSVIARRFGVSKSRAGQIVFGANQPTLTDPAPPVAVQPLALTTGRPSSQHCEKS